MTDNIYKSILKSAKFGYAFHKIVLSDSGIPVDYEFIEVNPAFEKLTGLKSSDILNRKVTDVIPDIKNDNFNWIETFADVAINRKTKEFEQYSKVFNLYFNLEVFSPEKYYFITIFNDITKNKIAEQKLKDSKEKYRSIVDQTTEMLFLHNMHGKIIEVNNESILQTGYSKDELLKMNIFDLYTDKSNNEAKINQWKKWSIKKPLTVEAQHIYKDGTIAPVEIICGKIKLGVEDYILSLVKDITKRKQAEEKLKKSEERLQSVIQSQKEMISRFTPDTTLTYVNNAYCSIIKKSPEGLIGQKWIDFVPPEQQPTIKMHLEELANDSENIVTYNYKLIFPDGNIRWMEWTNYVIKDDEGNFVEFQSVGYDITDRKEKEKLEKEIEVAKNTLQFKQNFLANMSHEIRTPLTGVLGITELLTKTDLSPLQQDYLNTLIQSGENLREIINLILDYSKIEAGHVKLKPAKFSIEKLLADTAKLFLPLAERKQIKLETHVSEDIPHLITCDRQRIYQILSNLISNAVKFTEKGNVTVKGTLKSGKTSKKNDDTDIVIKIEVSDTGKGISSFEKENLFKPFSQLEQDHTKPIDGTGLGLAICKELSTILGGEIGVKSEPGKGSNFWFTFKANTLNESTKTRKKSTGKNLSYKKPLHIMLVEDKKITQKVVELILNSAGHTVEIANNGKEALDLYKPGKYDLILMDIQMPVMDGITATNKLKKKHNKIPPIVGLSANAFEGDREKYMSQGMDEYLTKPMVLEEFYKALEKFNL